VANGHKNPVESLLKKGANVNDKNNEGNTPLMLAAANGHKDSVEFLLKNGANVNDKNNEGNTPLILAAANGHKDSVEFLLKNGANVNDKNNEGNTPLMLAATNKDKDIVLYLLKQGAEFDSNDSSVVNALTFTIFEQRCGSIREAATYGYVNVLKFLLTHGADINSEDSNKNTPLILAAANGHKDAVELLLNRGANVNDKNNEGKSPLYFALSSNNINLAKQILDALNIKISLKEDTVINPLQIKDLGSDEILTIHEVFLDPIGLKIVYCSEDGKYIDWKKKKEEVIRSLNYKDIDLSMDETAQYVLHLYDNSQNSMLVKNLTIANNKPEFLGSRKHNHFTYLLFKKIAGISIDEWIKQQVYIEDCLGHAVEIEKYDPSHELWSLFGDREIILIKESSISIIPKILKLSGKYLKSDIVDGCKQYYFVEVHSPKEWIKKKEQIVAFVSLNLNIIAKGEVIILQETIHQSLGRLLNIFNNNDQFPKLIYSSKENGLVVHYYSFLSGIDNWEMWNRNKNKIEDTLNTKVIIDDDEKNQMIKITEVKSLPAIIELDVVSEKLKKGEIYFGETTLGSRYTKIEDTKHQIIVGQSGSGKSVLINGLLLSILYNLEDVDKLYLVDLKGGVELYRYEQLSNKIEVIYEKERLLELCLKLELEMHARNRWMKNNGKVKIDQLPIFLIFDEFAQVMNIGYKEGRENILSRLTSISQLARAANIKLWVGLQSNTTDTIESAFRNNIQSRILMKVEDSLSINNTINEHIIKKLGVDVTRFKPGRMIYKDDNIGDGFEIQYPFIREDDYKRIEIKDNKKANLEELSKEFEKLKPIVLKEQLAKKKKGRFFDEEDLLRELSPDAFDSNLDIQRGEDEPTPMVTDVVFDEVEVSDFNFDSFLDDRPQEMDIAEEIKTINLKALEILKELKRSYNG
jgi:ankyrin repeat protein/energy-coupling factor transporter ATP-binding protein EcfA2